MTGVTEEKLREFVMRQSDWDRILADPTGVDKFVALVQQGMCTCIEYQGKILGIIGYYQYWPGVCEVFAFPSIYVEQYATVYLRTAKRYVRAISKSHDFHRIQTTTLADDVHDAWMKFLGFSNPQDVPEYSALREDYRLWSILPFRENEDRQDDSETCSS